MIERNGMYATERLSHSERLRLACHGCKHCSVELRRKTRHQWQEHLYMRCEHAEVHVQIDEQGYNLICSEFEGTNGPDGVWRASDD